MAVNNESSVIRGALGRRARPPTIPLQRRRSRSPARNSADYRTRVDSEENAQTSAGTPLDELDEREKKRQARFAKWEAIKAKHRADSAANSPASIAAEAASPSASVEAMQSQAPDLTKSRDMGPGEIEKARTSGTGAAQPSESTAVKQLTKPAQPKAQVEGDSKIVQETAESLIAPAKEEDKEEEEDDDSDLDMFATDPQKSSKPISLRKLAQSVNAGLDEDADDALGYLKYLPNEVIAGRYMVTQTLGRGTFATVVRVRDTTTGGLFAIKIIRRNDSMVKAAAKECQILEVLAKADVGDAKYVVRLDSRFYHKGHFCMAFENLDMSLRNAIEKYGRKKGLSLQAVRLYARQILLGLSLLKECNLVHADLKPDNMLLHESHKYMKICDLGSAAYIQDTEPATELGSRFYRSPEVMLGGKPECGIDMWSAGCTIFELATGQFLFTGGNNNQMLKSIQESRGAITFRLLNRFDNPVPATHFRVRNKQVLFKSHEINAFGEAVTKEIEFNHPKPNMDIRSRIMQGAGTPGKHVEEAATLRELADLLERMLTLDPHRRILPDAALEHRFFTK